MSCQSKHDTRIIFQNVFTTDMHASVSAPYRILICCMNPPTLRPWHAPQTSTKSWGRWALQMTPLKLPYTMFKCGTDCRESAIRNFFSNYKCLLSVLLFIYSSGSRWLFFLSTPFSLTCDLTAVVCVYVLVWCGVWDINWVSYFPPHQKGEIHLLRQNRDPDM